MAGNKHDEEHDHDHDHAHEEGEEWENEEDLDEDDIVVLSDADGNEKEFRFLTVVQLDEQDFALLTPATEDEDPEAATEIFIFRYEQDEDGGEIFSEIEDEDLFARVQTAAEQMLMSEDAD